jgi:hypothetical protein
MDPRARAWLWVCAPQAEYIDVSGGDFAYWHEIRARWDGTDDLVIVEQDNQISQNVIPGFEACDQPWCLYAYQGWSASVMLDQSLGCTRFSAQLQRDVPFRDFSQASVKWDVIDRVISGCLKSREYEPHVHGVIKHHHSYVMYFLKNGCYTWRHLNGRTQPSDTDIPGRRPVEIPQNCPRAIVSAGGATAVGTADLSPGEWLLLEEWIRVRSPSPELRAAERDGRMALILREAGLCEHARTVFRHEQKEQAK